MNTNQEKPHEWALLLPDGTWKTYHDIDDAVPEMNKWKVCHLYRLTVSKNKKDITKDIAVCLG